MALRYHEYICICSDGTFNYFILATFHWKVLIAIYAALWPANMGSIKEILCVGIIQVFSYFLHLDLELVNMSSKRPKRV